MHNSELSNKELDYYKRRVDELAGENMRLDYKISGLHYSLKQKRQGFALLTELQQSIDLNQSVSSIFELVISAASAKLGMDRIVILSPDGEENRYRPSKWLGFREEAASSLAKIEIIFPSTFKNGSGLLIVNKSTEPAPLIEEIQSAFNLPFFVCVPVIGEGGINSILLAGRMKEMKPIFPPLDQRDADTLQAIAGLISASIRNMRIADLEELNRRLEIQRDELTQALRDLEAAQEQLVQQEKLASLGQLTAGIAHEIKNPLNFVNNFSDVSIEMVEEAREELKSEKGNGKGQKAELLAILDDVEANLRKIHEHGSRADGIVKSMLLHSRGKSGEKTSTDLNKLLDEYVNLAYHGMRATDKAFNIDIQTNFDENIPKMDVVAQDISRALLNIINNGMYAAHEKAQQNGKEPPALSVQTKQVNDEAEIRIRDNGPGIPDKIREKIFEPFFTTKPTGKGTGLGLSMTYDIIKMHNGKLSVESEEGAYTEFKIVLPVTKQKKIN